jgi:hypothetical protein
MTPRDRLMGTVGTLSEAFRELDHVGPLLDEPERSAVRLIRDDISRLQRRLTACAALAGAGAR